MFSLIIMQSTLLFFGILKTMFFLRVNEYFSMLCQLLYQCLVDLFAFMIFFVAWLFLFSFLYKISGSGVSQDDYPHVTPYIYYVIVIMRNSIGDEQMPTYDFWANRIGSDPVLANTMIGYAWVLWFMQAFFMLIILLNFLIAIVSQSYDSVIASQMQVNYQTKCDQNIE